MTVCIQDYFLFIPLSNLYHVFNRFNQMPRGKHISLRGTIKKP